MGENPVLREVFSVSQNLYVEYLNRFYILLARIYSPFGYYTCCRNIYGKFSQSRAKYGKSPTKFCRFFLFGTSRFHPIPLSWSKYFSNMESTGYHLCNDICFVWVYCFSTMLMTSYFVGATPILGRKRITPLQPLGDCSGSTGDTDNVERP